VLRLDDRWSNPRHPPQFHVLVFALEGRLWMYDSNEGTQSLSLYADRLEHDKADLAPLLRTVLPGLVGFQDVTDEPVAPGPPPSRPRWGRDADLPFGCFIACVVHWRDLQAGAAPPDEAGVLAYYFDTGAGPHGHAVLVYRQHGRRYAYDPADGRTAGVPAGSPNSTPLQLARIVATLQIPFKARLLALHPPAGLRTVAAVNFTAEEREPTAGPPAPSGPAGP
jgi:hypothetical protein